MRENIKPSVIKWLIVAAYGSQRAGATALGLNERSVRRWTLGEAYPEKKHLQRIYRDVKKRMDFIAESLDIIVSL